MLSEVDSPEEFQALLSRALSALEALAAESPGFPPFENIERQLIAIQEWTADGRTPTVEQKRLVDFGLVTARELDNDPDPRIIDLAEQLHELSYYFDNHM